MKIGIYLGARPGSGGMFQYSLSVLDALASFPAGEHSVVSAYEHPGWKRYLTERGMEGVHLGGNKGERKSFGWLWARLCLPLWLWRLIYWRMDRTARYFAKSGCDIWIFPAQDHWTYLSGVPAVGTVHDLMHRYEPHFSEVSSAGRYRLREYRFRSLCEASRAVLVDSNTGKQHVVESYGVAPGKIYPLPYVPPRYIFDAVTPPDFNKRFPLPPKYFFYPAQFWEHKNHMRLLQAMADVRGECPGIQLILAGPKDHAYETVRGEAERLGLADAVHFIGYIPDDCLPELYRRARALVMPTFFGPTNIPPLEAQALGCPVAISGTYGMPEQLGDAAMFVDPASVDSIAAALKILWNDDSCCTSLRDKGLIRAQQWKQQHFNHRFQEILRMVLHP